MQPIPWLVPEPNLARPRGGNQRHRRHGKEKETWGQLQSDFTGRGSVDRWMVMVQGEGVWTVDTGAWSAMAIVAPEKHLRARRAATAATVAAA